VGLLTLYSMTKIWAEGFWKAAPADAPAADRSGLPLLVGPAVALAALTVAIGLGAEPLVQLATRAADQLLDREGYIRAVLGDTP
jgi:multicomponent Na+:H+ antiporter subunit D